MEYYLNRVAWKAALIKRYLSVKLKEMRKGDIHICVFGREVLQAEGIQTNEKS